MSSAAIEVSGIAEQSSRLSLKKAMEQFGEVTGCHMGQRGVDLPIVRFQTQAMAETALDALKGGQVWLDGCVLSAEWRGSGGPKSAPGPPPGSGPALRRDEAAMDMGSRDLLGGSRGGGGGRGGRSRSREKDRNKDKD
ncbi:unnamed protein product [Prorocentrum cordatum]|nr:unnamed protein product [Polarella glacialis]